MKLFSPLQRSVTRYALLAFAVLSASVAAVVLPPTATTTLTEQRSLAPSAIATREVSLPTKDLLYDPVTQRIYASVPSSAGAIGNSITAIDPVAGTVGASVSIGSEPGKLAISSDLKYIYASLDGVASVRRFDLTTQTAGLQFLVGTGSSGTFYAEDMAVLPGQQDVIAISRKYLGISPRHGGVGIYDNGVVRPTTTATHTGSNVIEFSATASTLYGYNNETTDFGFRKMTVDASGVSVVSNTRNAISGFGADIAYDNGLIYATSGQVINAETGTQVGRFPGLTFPAIVRPDSSTNTVYFLSGTGVTTSLKAFNQTTFVQTGQLALTNVSGTPGSLIKWGSDGLAFRTTGNQVVLISTSDILPIATPIPTPTQVASGIIKLPLATNDLVYDSTTAKVYATLPGTAGTFGNSIAAIDPVTGTMNAPVFVGSEPDKVAISANHQFIYAGLNGAAGVRRFDLASQSPGLQFNLGANSLTGPFTVEDIAVLPDDPNAVAVSRRNLGFSPKHEGVGIYDNGVIRTNATAAHTGSNAIEFSASAATLYGYNNETSEFGVRKMAVSASGVSVTSTNTSLISGFSVDIKFDNGRIYSSNGRAIDPEAGTVLGTFPGANSLAFVPDSTLNRAFFVDGNGSSGTLKTFNLTTFQPAGVLMLPGVTGTPVSLVRWGSDGLALRTSDNQVYFIQSSLLSSTSNLLVNSLADTPDSNAGDGRCDVDGNLGNGDQCTLRAAIQEANVAAVPVTITFDATLSQQTIVLNTALDAINNNFTITGPGAGFLVVQRNLNEFTPDFRIFTINAGKTVTISGLAVSNGIASGVTGGGISNSGSLTLSGVTVFGSAGGGGIQNLGTLTVNSCIVTGNIGGGIASSAFGSNTTVTINGSAITGNTGNGGLYNNGANSIATMVVNNTTISANSATGSGGGVFNGAASFSSRGFLTINNSTISGNTAGGGGGGLYNAAVFGNAATEVTINNSTISGNSDSSASGGGGIYHLSSGSGSSATLTVNSGTIFGNNANGGSGGGILTSLFNSTTTLNLRSTLVAGNLRSAGAFRSDIAGTVDAASYSNLIGDGTDMTGVSNGSNGNQVGTSLAPINPQLGPLANNGGNTQTHSLLVSSPALDAGADVPLTTARRRFSAEG